MSPAIRGALCLGVAIVLLACSKPVPIRVKVEGTKAEPARIHCPPCECQACEVCPAIPVAPPEAPTPEAPASEEAPAHIPSHLRPDESQCQRACARLMDVEVRRMEARMEKAKAGLKKALRKGLKEESALLTADCVTRCLSEFTVTTTACIVKYEALDAINQCILKMTLE